MKLHLQKSPKVLLKLGIPIAFVAVFLIGWYVGLPPEKEKQSTENDTVWTCSMHPQIRQPEFGLCPLCAMDLIPLESGGESGLREINISPEAAALMDVRVSPIMRRPASVTVSLFGKIAYDERNVTTTTARIGGRLDRFYIDYTGTVVSKGDHIAEIYSPELFVAQQDLIKATNGLAAARRTGTAAAAQTQERLLKSARERLRLLQLTDEQIDAIAAQSEPTDHITLFAPQDGVVTERKVVQGSYVKTGEPLFSVAGLQSVWLNLEAYESDLTWLHFAQRVTFTVEAIPGRQFAGRIAYIDPEIDAVRRVVRVRVNVDNASRLLKPGMFARAEVGATVTGEGKVVDLGLAGKWISPMHPEIIRDEAGKCPICGMDLVPAEELGFVGTTGGEQENALLVPASAVLQTGERAVVYVRVKAIPGPRFEGREVVLGPKVGDSFVVESGLSEGEMVVTRGAFKLDSELQLKARPSMMNRDAGLTEIPAKEAEESLLGQWDMIPRALGRLRAAVENGDESKANEEAAQIESAISGMVTTSFAPKTLTLWKEFSNRLQNALTEFKLSDPSSLEMAFQKLRLAVEETGRYLGVPYQPTDTGTEAPDERLAELRIALDAYYPLAQALADDDAKAAKTAVDALAIHLTKLRIPAETLQKADDIKSIRSAFKPVSDTLIAQVKDYGLDRVGNAYIVHCPMAFDYEGADWLSTDAQILNPYFGEEMLTCGTIKANLSYRGRHSTSDESPQTHAPDHQH